MRRAAIALLLLFAVLPATAHAKEISKVGVCGASGCLDVTDRDRIAAVIDSGPPASPPEAKAPFFRLTVTISHEGEEIAENTLVYVPSAHLVRGEGENGPAWMRPGARTDRALRAVTAGLPPFPATALGSTAAKPPEARVVEVVEPPTAHADGGDGWIAWVAGAAAALVIAGLLRRRRARLAALSCLALALAALGAAGAQAKGITGAVACGAGTCREVTLRGDRLFALEGAVPSHPPSRAYPFFHITLVMAHGDASGVEMRWMPAINRLRDDDPTGPPVWLEPSPRGRRALERATAGLRPYPASRLEPSALHPTIEVTPPARREDSDATTWLLLGGSIALALGLAATVVRRRHPRPG